MPQPIIDFLLQTIASAGGAAAVVVLLLKSFGGKWMEARFGRSLEAFRHTQSIELERFKSDINVQFDRRTKLQHREFEVLPEVWAHLVEAHSIAGSFTSLVQSVPDFKRMNAEHIEDLIRNSPLADWQRSEFRTAPDKQEYYRNAMFWYRLDEANIKLWQHRSFLLKNSIFVSEAVRCEIERMEGLIRGAVIESEIYHRTGDGFREVKERRALMDNGAAALKRVELEMRRTLWADEQTGRKN